jgi:hypothetical protein
VKYSSALLSHPVAIAAVAVLLSSCSSPGGTASPPAALLQPASKGWVSPDLKGKPLAFIGDYGGIDIFSLPDFKLKRALTVVGTPACSDGSNVWVVSTGTEQVIELSRAGKEIASLSDSVGYPVGCAVDKAGDLAVTDIFGLNGAGQVLLYKHATGTPTELSNPGQYYYYYDGFDTSGNLYASGKSSTGSYMLSECKAGSTSCTTITISGGTVYFPGIVQWYKPGGYVAVGDQLCGDTEAACIYSVQISGSQGTITGKTTLLNSSGGQVCDMTGGEIDPVSGKYLVGTDYEYCGTTPSSADYWPYPAGGKPSHFVKLSEPGGVAISIK